MAEVDEDSSQREADAQPTRGGTPARRRRSLWWLLAFVVFLVTFAAVNVLYARSTAPPPSPELTLPGHATVYISPYSITPSEGQIKVKITPIFPDDVWFDGQLQKDVQVHLVSREDKVFPLARGTENPTVDAAVFVGDTTFERYPLDRYYGDIGAYVLILENGVPRPVATDVVVYGKFPGWRVFLASSEDPNQPGNQPDLDETDSSRWSSNVGYASLVIARNGSTMTFVVIILSAMLVLAVLALVVAWSVATRRRKLEATLAGWFAALLFAMVPLRTNLPGAPPIGVWIDFLVFLWTLVALMAALAIFIVSWLRYTPQPPTAGVPGGASSQ